MLLVFALASVLNDIHHMMRRKNCKSMTVMPRERGVSGNR
jgi:hypothetical protein